MTNTLPLQLTVKSIGSAGHLLKEAVVLQGGVGREMTLLLLCRQQRLAEWKATTLKNKFGDVLEISGKDYVQEITKAGEGLWVILHLYKQG